MLIIGVMTLIIVSLLGFELFDRIRRSKNPIPASPRSGKFFDSNFRKYLQPPSLIISRSGIEKNMIVVDLGCGSGAYSTNAARKVGKSGKVYAVDLQKEMIDQLRYKLNTPEYSDIKNIELIIASAHKLPFRSNSIDNIFMVDVINEIPNTQKALSEIKRVLKKDGKLSITEFFMDPDFRWKSYTVNNCEQAGFKVKKIFGSFFHYTIQFGINRD